MMGWVGVTSMRVMVAAVTVTDALPGTPDRVAEIDTVPAATPVSFALPVAPSAATVANAGEDVIHAACMVMSCLVPSANTPVAVIKMNCPTVTGVMPSMVML